MRRASRSRTLRRSRTAPSIGSVATATHGSGQTHQSLASSVSAIELVTADGELRLYSRRDDPEVFPGMVVGLGALGIVTALTLDLVPRFDVASTSTSISTGARPLSTSTRSRMRGTA